MYIAIYIFITLSYSDADKLLVLSGKKKSTSMTLSQPCMPKKTKKKTKISKSATTNQISKLCLKVTRKRKKKWLNTNLNNIIIALIILFCFDRKTSNGEGTLCSSLEG